MAFDYFPDLPDTLPPLLLCGDCKSAEEIPDHEVRHSRNTHCKSQLAVFTDLRRLIDSRLACEQAPKWGIWRKDGIDSFECRTVLYKL